VAVPQSLRAVGRDVAALDRSVYAAIARTPTPTLDDALRRLSDVANNSKLWLAIAAAIAAVGGGEGRRTAALGVTAVGITSATVNLAGKRLFDRARPDRTGVEVPVPRYVRMPTSTSFPSGHSASAFAFANAVAGQFPLAGFPLRALATAVAYSRVHTGVHFPSDVIIGSIIGAAIGDAVTAVGRRYWTRPL
jgi:membrane-associated phospholipid phosphatase